MEELSKRPSLDGPGKSAGRKTRSKKRPSTDEAWLELFDPAQMDHIADSVRVNILNVTHGAPSDMHVPIRRWLIEPLEAYMAAHWSAGVAHVEFSAAERLRDVAERLSEHFEDRYPFGDHDAQPWADRLRFAWLEFIAYGAGHRMWWDIPQSRAKRSTAASGPRGAGRLLTARGLADRMDELGCVEISQTLAEDLAADYGVKARTVYDRLEKARFLGMLPQP